MLVPAILYKTEIEEAFAKEIYTDDYFYYTGYAHGHELPNIVIEDNLYQWAIVDEKEKLIGYMAYRISGDCAYNFGLYSFDKGNLIVGRDLFAKMEELVQQYHRIEWHVVGGNHVKRSYDNFCKRHNGYCVRLHDVCKDNCGNYHDEYIYEIIDGGDLNV
jgi:hypothetical protein